MKLAWLKEMSWIEDMAWLKYGISILVIYRKITRMAHILFVSFKIEMLSKLCFS